MKKFMRLKIVSDGTIAGTNVVDAETGIPVTNVVSIDWSADSGRPERLIVATVRLLMPRIEVTGEFDVEEQRRAGGGDVVTTKTESV